MSELMTRWSQWKRIGCGKGRGGLALLLLMGALTWAPAGQVETSRRMIYGTRGMPDTTADVDPEFNARRMRALNEARRKTMVADTEKLLRLARELNAAAQSGSGPELMAAEAVKVPEIEKLAHRVKQKMSESLADGPLMHPLISPLDR